MRLDPLTSPPPTWTPGCALLPSGQVSHGASVNRLDLYGTSPLLEATQLQRVDLVSYLVRAGAAVNLLGPQGQTPLHMAAERGSSSVATGRGLRSGENSSKRHKVR